MRAQPCTSCGARWNVERLPDGATFACRRCGSEVVVGVQAPPAGALSPGLMVAGTLMLVGLFFYANPSFGYARTQWPWELWRADVPWSTRIGLALWALAGVHTLVTSLGIAPRSRSLLTLGLAGSLVMVCSAGLARPLRIDAAPLSLAPYLAVIAATAGTLLQARSQPALAARALAFGGGLAIVWCLALPELAGDHALRPLLADLRTRFGSGDHASLLDLWADVIPAWCLLAGGVAAIGVGFGASGRGLALTTATLFAIAMLSPVLADLIDRMGDEGFGDDAGRLFAEAGGRALITRGLALWWLATAALADLARNRKETG